MSQFEEYKKLVQRLRYPDFKPLQKEAFSNPSICIRNQNVFVIGETSTGKTLIPFLLFLRDYNEAKRNFSQTPKMIYAVPYRALATQKAKEIDQLLGEVNLDLKVVVSTGENGENDDNIKHGNVDIAVIITEKIYRFICCDDQVLSYYQFFVLDEVGLLNNDDRGCKIDFIFALTFQHQKIRNQDQGDFRVIALGTPFYNWNIYIFNYRFLKISVEGRPIQLKLLPVQYNTSYSASRTARICYDGSSTETIAYVKENHIISETSKLYCPIIHGACSLETKADHDTLCPAANHPCPIVLKVLPAGQNIVSTICSQICRWHLAQNRQILIFVNDREIVRQLSKDLFISLQDMLVPPPDIEICKHDIIQQIGIDEEDLWGILDDEHYQAIASGIAFHSAALPAGVRYWVEDHFLSSRKRTIRNKTNQTSLSNIRLKVVCSTETLAFGINSNVDVVIVADISKNENGRSRLLTTNEFQNYAGRAGRMQSNDMLAERVGYVFPLIKTQGYNDPETQKRLRWLKEQEKASESPSVLYSHFYSDSDDGQGSMLPFFLLTLLPMRGSMKVDEMVELLSILPHPPEINEMQVTNLCLSALYDLLENEMITETISLLSFSEDPSYKITPKGIQLRGYIIGINDYRILGKAIRHAVNVKKENSLLNEYSLLEELLNSRILKKTIDNIFRRHTYSDEELELIFLSFPKEIQTALRCSYKNQYNVRLLVALAALLDWGHGERVRRIYTKYKKLSYPLIQSLSQQICYLVEICQAMLPSEYQTLTPEKSEDLNNSFLHLWQSLFYGIDMTIYQKIINFMKEHDLSRYENWKTINTENSRTLRRAVTYYRFFERICGFVVTEEPPLPESDVHHICHEYRENIRKISNALDQLFTQTFGDIYSN